MKFNVKSFIFAVSLFFNLIITALMVFSSFQKNSKIICSYADENSITAASVVTFPKDGRANFDNLELSLKPGQKAILQYAVVFPAQKQANLLINALYDPSVISVRNTGLGVEILALAEGSTLMQALTNDGVKNIANVTVER